MFTHSLISLFLIEFIVILVDPEIDNDDYEEDAIEDDEDQVWCNKIEYIYYIVHFLYFLNIFMSNNILYYVFLQDMELDENDTFLPHDEDDE